ncbi:hypothetical protein [Subtercola endophyticus]|uniref:hypothetical protein n=1 Tax=Subtercola endophyticus TaxID=2895559 RepID=UPI001E3372E2|nr:hypothetical protein [Subtercola endophyticus]UFS60400.1 hypothetical protein LQ955_06545 [Subtercola endophyticus]
MLDDGTGTINPSLSPLYTALTSQKHARSARVWLIVSPDVTDLLRGIARGEHPIRHTTFTQHPRPKKVAHLRELFIELGLLDPVPLDIERFQTWLEKKLETEPPPLARLIKQYARWVHLNRMHHLAETSTLRRGTLLSARQSTTAALEFLRYLDEHGHTANQCTQSDIDNWLSTGPTTRSLARGFVRWGITQGHIPPVDFPYRTAKTEPIISQEERRRLLLRTLDADAPATNADRAAAILLLLYGQPLTRIVSMELTQITVTETVIIRITDDDLTIPPPFDAVLRRHLNTLPNQNTSAHREQQRLFPGVSPGQHLHQTTIMNRLRDSGMNLRGTRNASLRSLALEVPAPIIADSLGYSYQVTDKHRRNAGATFTDYVSRHALSNKKPS